MNLLIVPCGQRKKKLTYKAPAIDLYDGPTYKVLRKFYEPAKLQVLILSAKYGLLFPGDFIESYDQKMDLERAQELRASTNQFLQRYLYSHPTQKIFCALSKLYLEAIDLNVYVPGGIHYEHRGLGFKLSYVKKVLTGEIQ